MSTSKSPGLILSVLERAYAEWRDTWQVLLTCLAQFRRSPPGQLLKGDDNRDKILVCSSLSWLKQSLDFTAGKQYTGNLWVASSECVVGNRWSHVVLEMCLGHASLELSLRLIWGLVMLCICKFDLLTLAILFKQMLIMLYHFFFFIGKLQTKGKLRRRCIYVCIYVTFWQKNPHWHYPLLPIVQLTLNS